MLFQLVRKLFGEDLFYNHNNPNAVNTAAVCTISANGSRSNVLLEASWSYDSDPTTGFLLIEDGSGNELAKYWITKGGPGARKFHFMRGTSNRQLVVTLGAVSGVRGTLDTTSTLY